MKTIRYVALSIFFCGVISGAASAQAATESPRAAHPAGEDTRVSIFAKGASMSPFVAKVEASERKDLEFFPRANDLRLEFLSEEEEKARESAASGSEASKGKTQDFSRLPPREKLLAKYGDPTKDAPVLAIENAPTPFKAMMESLQENDQEIAFQYAKQYVRHLKNLQDRSTQVMSLVGFAQRRENMADDKGSWSKAPTLEEHKLLYQRDVEEALNNSSAEKGIEGAIDNAATMLIRKGREGLSQPSAQNPLALGVKR